jgi:hypothetical protein
MLPIPRVPIGVVASALILLFASPLVSALSIEDDVAIEARGSVRNLLAGTPRPNQLQVEDTEPFTRSVVRAADSVAGSFAYSAEADIGNLALKVAGSVTNAGPDALFAGGVPVLLSVAEVRDVITLSTGRTDSFDVTMELVVNGTIDAGVSSSIAANSLILLDAPGQLSVVDSSRYTGGPIAETLSVTMQVSGPEVTLAFQTLLSISVTRVAPGESVSGQLDNTAFIRLVLPDDVVVSGSSSGTFGVPIPEPIPEPGTLVLSAVGLLLLLGVARRPSAR